MSADWPDIHPGSGAGLGGKAREGFVGRETTNWPDGNPPSPQANWNQNLVRIGALTLDEEPTAPNSGLAEFLAWAWMRRGRCEPAGASALSPRKPLKLIMLAPGREEGAEAHPAPGLPCDCVAA